MNLSKRRHRFYNEQYTFGKEYLSTFLGIGNKDYRHKKVLEVGGGEFGLLKALQEYGADCTGIDISKDRVEFARSIHDAGSIHFMVGDICHYDSISREEDGFDLIVLRDVIEHIPDQREALSVCAQLLKPGGLLYISFPPILSPFGGHQQNLKWGRRLPYIHLLPDYFYKQVLKVIGADSASLEALLRTKSTGITIRKILKIIKMLPMKYRFKKCYLVRPEYEIRFHTKRRSYCVPNRIPYLNEFFSTGCLITLEKEQAIATEPPGKEQ
ncbi:MAG: class I SAM-dependent methyltransferase [candidate division KSB1 bacterium]|jgi:2-polyprenyl-3-methyl-5-hydroxy-6-metoxy-1,4-benzoquinol methylase|nr:class I SAM-dependent methyltransferase [candidate division KSB1 bacterium]